MNGRSDNPMSVARLVKQIIRKKWTRPLQNYILLLLKYDPSMTGSTIKYRTAADSDIPGMAGLRAEHWGTKEYWEKRVEWESLPYFCKNWQHGL